jgi:hypothetical protein
VTIHSEVLFASTYAVFLLIIAELLQWKGVRAQRQANAVFKDDPSWSHWQAGQFRIGLSRVLLALAAYILCVAIYHYHTIIESIVLILIGIVVVWEACRRLRSPPRDTSPIR